MDCNKEEAVRAKGIAEKKMLIKDFNGARNMVLKAQNLFPDIENMSQMLTVCDVHSTAEVKINGEMDWYGILQVTQTSDDITIKKQYRRLALLLHPDKNKFAGAEAAFKLVSEAHRTLSDRANRALHDMKIRGNVSSISAMQPAPDPNKTSCTKMKPETFSSNQTFWTMCPLCGARYQYYKIVLNKSLYCQSCKNPFAAHEFAMPSTGAHMQEEQTPTREKDSKMEGQQGRSDMEEALNDPEFCDFEKERDETNFAVDQIWAIYNNLDAMPRYYALIRQVYGPKFKLRFTWLEYDPKGKAETVWFEKGLPIGCGRFRLAGRSQQTNERQMFSHPMPWSKGTKKNSFDIFPRKREVWALFKDWDIEWSSGRHYEYEIVEVLSDLTEGDAICIRVVPLVKIQGFVSLFVHSSDELTIPTKDILRFSHKIPSHRMSGNEREFVPKGSLELDCASLPTSSKGGCGQDCYEYPEPEFHAFDEERAASKFEAGQIWALYSDIDRNPNYYGRVSKVESGRFRVHVTWLAGCTELDRERHWINQQLPVGCGGFKIIRDTSVFDTTDTFSHIVHADLTVRKDRYVIDPLVGEIWAVYKNWRLEWLISDLDDCEYDIVEVVDGYGSGFVVLVLEKVNGYRAVFRGEVSGKRMNITLDERLRFSHKIPAFRLTEERGGKLRGYWELDPASVPDLFLFTNSD